MNILKKKVHILLLLLTISITSMIGISNAFAGTSIDPSNPPGGGNGGCGGNNCFAYGITGVRFALVNSKGEIVDPDHGHPVDYWYFTDASDSARLDLKSDSNNHQVAFKKKYLKQELLDESEENLIANLDVDGFGSFTSFEPLKNVYDASGLNPANNYNYSNYILKRYRKSELINYIAKEIIDVQANLDPKEYSFLNNIFSDMGYSFTAETMVNNGYYLQMEPLLTWSHGYVYETPTGSFVFHGTVSELMAIAQYRLIKIPWSSTSDGTGYIYPFAPAYDNPPTAPCRPRGEHRWCNHNIDTSFFLNVGPGVYASRADHMPENFNAVSTQATWAYEFYEKYDGKYNAYGIGYLDLSELIPEKEKCSKITNDYIDSGVSVEQFKTEIINELKSKMLDVPEQTIKDSYGWLSEFDSYGFENLHTLKKYLSRAGYENCPISCDNVARYTLQSKIDSATDSNVKMNESKFKSKYSAEFSLTSFYEAKKKGITYNYSSVLNYCDPLTCSQSLVDDNKNKGENVQKLYDFFISGDPSISYYFLNYNHLTAPAGEPDNGVGLDEAEALSLASCEELKICPPSEVKIEECKEDNSSKITFADNTNAGCISSNIAYNKENISNTGGDDATTEFNNDSTYGANGYCWESVTFEFPSAVSEATAGLIMKWGTEGSNTNDKFGTMKVYRKCYIDSDNIEDKFEIKSSWADVVSPSSVSGARINPKIEMNYREAVQNTNTPFELNPKIDLGVRLSKFEFVISGGKGTGSTSTDRAVVYYDKNGNEILGPESKKFDNNTEGNEQRNRSFVCGGKCNSINYVEMTGTYDIVYPDELTWYSDSQDNYMKKNKSQIMTDDPDFFTASGAARYISIGYGLPTSFLTPESKNGEWYGLSSDDSGGYMYVNISQIGTQTGTNQYHFDKLIQYLVDSKYKTSDSSIKYGCPFRIGNPLYDNENKGGGNKIPPFNEGKPEYTPTGLDVVFRTVQLVDTDISVAFPGRSGDGARIKGANWNKLENLAIQSVLNNKIYEDEPKYKITLDSVLIQKIREDNKSTDNPYVSMKNYQFKNRTGVYNKDHLEDSRNDGLAKNYKSTNVYVYFNSKYGEAGKTFELKDYEYDYTYAASDFLSYLAYTKRGASDKTKLTGSCIEASWESGIRAWIYSYSYGCH